MFLHNHLSDNFCCACIHAGEPLFWNRAVIAGQLESMRAHTILLWFTVIHSLSYFFTVINFHDDVFSCNYHLGIVVHFRSIEAFKF